MASAFETREEDLAIALDDLLSFVGNDHAFIQATELLSVALASRDAADYPNDYMAVAAALANALSVKADGAPYALSVDDRNAFAVEFAGFLRDQGFPTQALGKSGFADGSVRLHALEFLAAELQAVSLIASRESSNNDGNILSTGAAPMQTTTTDGDVGTPLSALAFALQVPVVASASDGGRATLTQDSLLKLLNSCQQSIVRLLGSLPSTHLGEPLLHKKLTSEHHARLTRINQDLEQEYTLRRRMLLKRLDVTVQSFEWSTRAQSKLDALQSAFQTQRTKLSPVAHIDVYAVLAARSNLLRITKASDESTRRKVRSSLYQVVMGKVPDRGGRAKEARGARMPAFAKRDAAVSEASGSGSRGGHRGQGQGHGQGGHSKHGHNNNKGKGGRR